MTARVAQAHHGASLGALRGHHIVMAVLVVSWLPATGVAQGVSYALIPLLAVFALLSGIAKLWRPAVIAFVTLFVVSGLALVSHPEAIRPLNVAVAAGTHASALLLLLTFDFRATGFQPIVRLVAALSILEAALAATQIVVSTGGLVFATMASGDRAVGSLLDNSHLFAAKMLCQATILGIALLFRVRPAGTRFGFISALFGAVLGSALFSTALFLTALVGFVVFAPNALTSGMRRRTLAWIRMSTITASLVLLGLFVLLQSDNVRYAQRVLLNAPQLVSEARAGTTGSNQGKILGSLAAWRTLTDSQTTLLFGTGPGHYSSRAALILSGGYLSDQPAIVPVSRSPFTTSDIYPLWNPSVWQVRFQDGVLNQPFYQFQTLLLELGLVGATVIALLFVATWRAVAARTQRNGIPASRALRTSALVLACATLALGFSENWLEYPHFIAPVYALVVAARSIRAPEMRR